MPEFSNTISAAASALIELLKRPVRAVGRFCGRVVNAVASIKKKFLVIILLVPTHQHP